MRSILFFIDTIYGNIFGCNYLRKKATFAIRNGTFFVQLGNLDSILKKLKKKMTLTADLFLNLRTPKTVVR